MKAGETLEERVRNHVKSWMVTHYHQIDDYSVVIEHILMIEKTFQLNRTETIALYEMWLDQQDHEIQLAKLLTQGEIDAGTYVAGKAAHAC